MNVDKELIRHWANLCEEAEPTMEELDFVGDPDEEEQRRSSNSRNAMTSIDDRIGFKREMQKHPELFQDVMLTVLSQLCVSKRRKEILDIVSDWADMNRKDGGEAVDEVAKNLKGYLSRVDAGDIEYRYSKNDVYESGEGEVMD